MKDSGAMGVVAGREASVGFMGKAGKAKTKSILYGINVTIHRWMARIKEVIQFI